MAALAYHERNSDHCDQEAIMTDSTHSTPEFSLEVDGIQGFCPPGEAWAKQHISQNKIPVLSCEGPCVRGDIARLAANMVAEEEPYARCCYQEAFNVPYSSMARWVNEEADKVVMIDGCFLTCVGRTLNNLVEQDVFAMDDVPLEERRAVARQVADEILTKLKQEKESETSEA
jgi:uncharacterized metal-binding protein